MSLTSGTQLGPYTIVGSLGAGGMGEVWLARDSRLEREVALKVLPERLTSDSEALAMFRNEALALATLNHPNIATIHGLEEVPGGTMVLVLERVDGETLLRRLEQGALPMEEALQVMAQVAQALEVAHESGVVHRDLKPSNIMLGARGLVKVLDFGLAKRTHGLGNIPAAAADAAPGWTQAPAGASLTGAVAGTPGYMSPEQVLAGTQGPRTDMFSFGCVLYEALTGLRAFPSDEPFVAMAQVLHEVPDLDALPPRLPPAVRAMLSACLDKDAESRPGSMRELRFTLEEVLGIRRAAALREGEAVSTPHNLPAHATSFVGRQSTLSECASALSGTRLLTLTGLGGSGKTRLALELAGGRLESFPDGVWFVDVAPLSHAERLIEAVGAVLGVPDVPGHSLLDSVLAWLRTRRVLLVVDNAETQREACAELARAVLRGCPEVKLLATSREPLEVEGETLYAVPSLGLPDRDVRGAADAAHSEAVRLFVDRARAVAPTFALTDSNAAAVVEICRRLDGIPLALELAAARARVLTVEQIRDRLGDRFKLLARAGAPPRQQTVLAVIQWSWDHLLPPEQELMRRLAVFHGGWTLEHATAVCFEDGDEFVVLDLITRLVERSLVVVHHEETGTRYQFLESVWRFALDQLAGRPEHDMLRERHFATFFRMAVECESHLAGPEHQSTLRRLAHDEENLLAALEWSPQATDGIQRGLKMVSATYRVWSLSGRYSMMARVILDALARDTERRPTAARAVALARGAGSLLTLNEASRARPLLDEALAISRRMGDTQGEARALAGLGVHTMLEERFTEALELGRQSLELYRKLGQTRGVAMALHNLATLEAVVGTPDLGRDHFEQALRLTREIGDVTVESLVLGGLVSSTVRLGDLALARTHIRELAERMRSVGAVRESVYALEAIGEFLVATGRHGEAAQAFGAARAAREQSSSPLTAAERREHERFEAEIEAALGAEEVRRRAAAGAALPLASAIAAAAAAAEPTSA